MRGSVRRQAGSGEAALHHAANAHAVEGMPVPKELTPVIYLPGFSRQDLRAIESCPESLKPLAELQYRGVIWSQVNAKDWTILAFLKSNQGGLGLNVAQDADTKDAMQLSLFRVLDEELQTLRGRHLDKDYFNTLLSGGDPIRDLLQWLDQGDGFRAGRDENTWRAFVEVCKSTLGLDPEKDGPLKAASLLAQHKGPWGSVWSRFCEAPRRYTLVPGLIRKTVMPQDFFEDKTGWPQWNEQRESLLRESLVYLAKLPPHEARVKILALEKEESPRCDTVWSELGESPLANALVKLAVVANITEHSLAAGRPADMAKAYESFGWKADDAALKAMACVLTQDDVKAICSVLQTIYLPWVDDAARHLQSQVEKAGYPGGFAKDRSPEVSKPGTCILFMDGLRLDLANRMETRLKFQGFSVESTTRWAALPSVTATAKPAVMPMQHLIRGQEVNADFEPSVAATGQSLKGGYHFKKLLTDNGWQILERSSTGDPAGLAWTEIGDFDREGHARGAMLGRYVEAILADACDRVLQLLRAGWKTVRIVTDHGCLLMPGGLPKTELPTALSDNTWGRCAAIKPGAVCDETLYHWYWNIDLSFALPPGCSSYKPGKEYTHGGLSLQECLVNTMTVVQTGPTKKSLSIEISDVHWVGMRCKVVIEGGESGLLLDIRTHAGDVASTKAYSVGKFKEDGTGSVVVSDDRLVGDAAVIVVLDKDGNLIAERSTKIGGENK